VTDARSVPPAKPETVACDHATGGLAESLSNKERSPLKLRESTRIRHDSTTIYFEEQKVYKNQHFCHEA
jgi:hypothetical protein